MRRRPAVLVELDLVEQRYKAVCEVLDGATVVDVAQRNGVAALLAVAAAAARSGGSSVTAIAEGYRSAMEVTAGLAVVATAATLLFIREGVCREPAERIADASSPADTEFAEASRQLRTPRWSPRSRGVPC
jgi:transposase-like protein